ncbi:MAG: hypothetical protein EKK34_12630 [Mycobacterium sp.]|nr:MAG: hypothetical protein EKK34_12630 [Mycobacterium sp.]
MASHKDCDHASNSGARHACRMAQNGEYRERRSEWHRKYNAQPVRRERRRVRAARPKRRERKRMYYATWTPEQYAKHVARNLKRRHLMADTAVEPIFNEEIFERDKWVCQLCFEDVDPLLFYPHPESASLDHITPLSLGGTHTEDNVQLAHFRCNCSKGNRYEVAL